MGLPKRVTETPNKFYEPIINLLPPAVGETSAEKKLEAKIRNKVAEDLKRARWWYYHYETRSNPQPFDKTSNPIQPYKVSPEKTYAECAREAGHIEANCKERENSSYPAILAAQVLLIIGTMFAALNKDHKLNVSLPAGCALVGILILSTVLSIRGPAIVNKKKLKIASGLKSKFEQASQAAQNSPQRPSLTA